LESRIGNVLRWFKATNKAFAARSSNCTQMTANRKEFKCSERSVLARLPPDADLAGSHRQAATRGGLMRPAAFPDAQQAPIFC
jgi:hypothetical protein